VTKRKSTEGSILFVSLPSRSKSLELFPSTGFIPQTPVYAATANAFIGALDAISTDIEPVSVNDVAKAGPLVFPHALSLRMQSSATGTQIRHNR
jgi:hypothetical protein